MPRAHLLTLTSPSTLHRPHCLRSQTSSGYIATWLERHQGHSARSPVAHFDEPIYPAQATLPQESDQLRLHHHSTLNASKATVPRATLLTLTSSSHHSTGRASTIHIDELFPSTKMDELPLYTLTSSSTQLRWTSPHNTLRRALHYTSDRRAPSYNSY